MDCKLAWLCLFVEAWVGTSAGLLFSQGFDSRASALGHKSERVGGTEDGAEAVPGRALAACGVML